MNILRAFVLLVSLTLLSIGRGETMQIGVAQVDVTPDYPIRLNGFAKRKTESDGVLGRIWVKALAFADEKEGPAILITTDGLGVPASIVDEVARRLAQPLNLKRERLTITATHTHSAPMLRGVANAIFGHDLSPEEWEHINRYTEEFTNALEAVALAAVKDVRPATVELAIGKAGFAMNRRTKGGPVDHDLPVLVIRDVNDNKPRAVWFSYACHCVVLAESKIHGDWAGAAMEMIQADFPGTIVLASIGCGADQNPSSRDSVEIANQHGRLIADEVKRLITGGEGAENGGSKAITVEPSIRRVETNLEYEQRSRAEWLEMLKKGGQLAYYARLNLTRIDHGETLPIHLSYSVQTWTFGDQLALVFLPGEVVVDFGLRLKRELRDVIPIAYANDAPGYIPSERVLKEGGYEGGGAMMYYDRPNRFAPGLEEKIIEAARAQLRSFAR